MNDPAAVTDRPRASSRGRREFATAAIAILLGGGLALLAAARTWSRVTLHRTAPLSSITLDVTGRALHPAVAALGVVALAGVVAVVATRGWARVGLAGLLVVTGGLLAWQAALGFGTVSPDRGRSLIAQARTGVALNPADPISVSTHPAWPLAALLGALVIVAGAGRVAGRGRAWSALSARYDRPAGSASGPVEPGPAAGGEDARARADLALWQSLERGEDPTA